MNLWEVFCHVDDFDSDFLNDLVLPFFDQSEIPLLCILSDRRIDFCSTLQHHAWVLYLAIENKPY